MTKDKTFRFNIVKAQISDLPRILDIYKYAREFMKSTGNPHQWQDSFPPEALLANDITEKNHLYVLKTDDGEIHGVFAFIRGKDPTYSVIKDGHWLSDDEYATLHRVAGDGEVNGLFDAIVAFCRSQIPHLRIDTHADNKIMQHLIEKNGFKKCGLIFTDDGTSRIAYEMV